MLWGLVKSVRRHEIKGELVCGNIPRVTPIDLPRHWAYNPRAYLSLFFLKPFTAQACMSSRRRAREIVLQLLYEADVNDSRGAVEAKKFIRSRMQGRSALTNFASALLLGTLEHREEVDQRLKRLASRWSLSRMPVVDRNILRLGGYEIMFGDTPDRVAVNEAILLAKRYGDKNSPRFVNGVLDRLMNTTAEELAAEEASEVTSEESGNESGEDSASEEHGESGQADNDAV